MIEIHCLVFVHFEPLWRNKLNVLEEKTCSDEFVHDIRTYIEAWETLFETL